MIPASERGTVEGWPKIANPVLMPFSALVFDRLVTPLSHDGGYGALLYPSTGFIFGREEGQLAPLLGNNRSSP